jgi:DNA-nicking Smr family endonuclease
VPERLASPFKESLGPLKQRMAEEAKRAQQKPAPSSPSVVTRAPSGAPPRPAKRRAASMAEEEAQALSLAMHGVTPLGDGKAARVIAGTPRVPTRTAQVASFGASAEEEARSRLERLVASGVSFQIEREPDYVRGLRNDVPPRVLRELSRRTRAHATLDLHGKTQPEARAAVTAFVRDAARKGLSAVCLVHGKGHHSEGGQGVLREVVVAALTETGAAPHVLAFVSAPEALGGSGALLVEIGRR